MNVQRDFLFLAMAMAAAAGPALAQIGVPAAAQTGVGQGVASSVPDFSGIWRHPSFPGFEPLASGPTSVTNLSRRDGRNDLYHSVGDYNNPILKPHAAEIVKKHAEMALAGGYPTPSTQCTPGGVPYILASFGLQVLQQPHQVTLLFDHPFFEFRQVRMNQPHAQPVTPTWYGDSVGRYEGDTLVVDTVGIKVGPLAMVDMYGTPFTSALHVVERYRLIDYEAAKEGIERDAKANNRFVRSFDQTYRGKHLQLFFTVEDEGVFTTPWSATITYGRDIPQELALEREEHICAENPPYYYGPPPTAQKADF
jgi:hypothetical protein